MHLIIPFLISALASGILYDIIKIVMQMLSKRR
jgi:hypothetical protein